MKELQEKIIKILEREDNTIGVSLTYKEEAEEIIKTCRQEITKEVIERIDEKEKEGTNTREFWHNQALNDIKEIIKEL